MGGRDERPPPHAAAAALGATGHEHVVQRTQLAVPANEVLVTAPHVPGREVRQCNAVEPLGDVSIKSREAFR